MGGAAGWAAAPGQWASNRLQARACGACLEIEIRSCGWRDALALHALVGCTACRLPPLLPPAGTCPPTRSVIVSRAANESGAAAQFLAEASNTSATVALSDDCSLASADWHIEPIPSTVDCQYDLGDSPFSPATFNDSQVRGTGRVHCCQWLRRPSSSLASY